MRKNILSLSIAAMIGGLGFAGAASAGIAYEASAVTSTAPTGVTGVTTADLLPATTAAALVLSADGVGHNLLTPYFSVQNGNGTLLSIVNTDAKNGKAVKVRFRGAANSDDIFDFTVLMSPGDVWTANVYKDADTGLARLYTPDNSCTLPRRSELNNQQFKIDRVYGADDAAKAAQTLEGYVEIFNMADIPARVPGVALTGVIAENGAELIANPLFTAIKHVAGKNPCGSTADGAPLPAAVLKLKADPALANILTASAADNTLILKHGLWAPSTGLMGSWTILNQSTGFVSWSANMVAVEARLTAAGKAARGRVVFSPQMDTSVDGGVINQLTADPLLRTIGTAGSTGVVPAAEYDLPDMSTPYLTTAGLVGVGKVAATDDPVLQANALTKSLAIQSVMNEYVTNPAISAQTDWVFSMPTRRYAVGVNYAPGVSATNPTGKPVAVFNDATDQKVTVAHISPYFTAVNTKMGTAGTSGNPVYQACVETGAGANTVTAYDQEETSASSDFVVSPGTAKKVVFCGETSVLTVNGTTALGAAIAAKDIDTNFNDGWMNIATPGNVVATIKQGLPVLGHSFVKMTGAPADGKSTNYSITQEHRFTR